MTDRTRFAPSPTGLLHLGHAFSALLGSDMAQRMGGEWLLRIEDIDRQRSRPEWERALYEDLVWLGLSWPEPVMRQSERIGAYQEALRSLDARGLLFGCGCSRADVAQALSAPQEGGPPVLGPDGLVYPGTCRPTAPKTTLPLGEAAALRLWMGRATAGEAPFSFVETGEGPNGEHGTIIVTAEELDTHVGDVVLARRGMGTSYHLSVVLDDAAQGITHVVRGQDLFEATKIHVVLQRLLGLPTPTYHHHRLIRDEAGRRLAKREDAKAIRRFRDEGATPRDIRRMVGL